MKESDTPPVGSSVIACPCQETVAGFEFATIEHLEDLRGKCPAIRLILAPDSAWPQFRTWHITRDTVALHRSVLIVGLAWGRLSRITAPIHRFLLDGDQVRSRVGNQYLKDLKETWMLRPDVLERHRKSRIFRGRLAELAFAAWLEVSGWTINGLEALGASSDIVALRNEVSARIETKWIGAEDDDFLGIVDSLAGLPSGGSVSVMGPINYLLFRIYEAAKQLQRGFGGKAVVAILIEDLAWWRFDTQLAHGWFDWDNPHFVDADAEWAEFLARKLLEDPNLHRDLAATVKSVDAVWIFNNKDLGFELRHVLPDDALRPS